MKPDAATGTPDNKLDLGQAANAENDHSAKKSEEQWEILSPEQAAKHVKEIARELGISHKAALWLLTTDKEAYTQIAKHLASTKQPEQSESHTPEDDRINPQLAQLIGEFIFNIENLTAKQLREILQSLRQNKEFTHFDFIATLITGRFLDFARINGVDLSRESPPTTLEESQTLVFDMLTKLGIPDLFDENQVQELAKLYLAVQNVQQTSTGFENDLDENINYPDRPTVVKIYLDENNKPIAVKLFVGKEKELVKAPHPEQVEEGKIVLRPSASVMESAVILIDPDKIKEVLRQNITGAPEQISAVTAGIEVEAFLTGLLGEDIINFVTSLPEGHPLGEMFQELLAAMVEAQSEPFTLAQPDRYEEILKRLIELQVAITQYKDKQFASSPKIGFHVYPPSISFSGATPLRPKAKEEWVDILSNLLSGLVAEYVNRMAQTLADTLKRKVWIQTPNEDLNTNLGKFPKWHEQLKKELANHFGINLDELTPGQTFALAFPVSATHTSIQMATHVTNLDGQEQKVIIFDANSYPILLSAAPLNFFGSALWGEVNKDVFSVRQALQSFVPQGRPGSEIIVPSRVGEWLTYAQLAFSAHPKRTGPIPFIGRTAQVAVRRDENRIITDITNIAYSEYRNRIGSKPHRIEYTDPDGMPPIGKAFVNTAIIPPLLAEITTRALHIEQYLHNSHPNSQLEQAFNNLQEKYNQIAQEYGSLINFKKHLNFGDFNAYKHREELIQAYEKVINELLKAARRNPYIRTLLQKSLGENYENIVKQYLTYIEAENQLAIDYLTNKQSLGDKNSITFMSQTIQLTTENGEKRPFSEFLKDAVEHGLPWWVIEKYAYNYFGLNPATFHQEIWRLTIAHYEDITSEPTSKRIAHQSNVVKGPFTPVVIKSQTS